MVNPKFTSDEILTALQDVMDPEIPKLSVVDMGIITSAASDENGNIKVVMTPTFAGCPAVGMMKNDIKNRLKDMTAGEVDVEVSFDVQWSTDMLTERGKRMLKESNFALPGKVNGFVSAESLFRVECPFCGSNNTRLKSAFGPTQCRAIHYCDNCLQSFEQFKPV